MKNMEIYCRERGRIKFVFVLPVSKKSRKKKKIQNKVKKNKKNVRNYAKNIYEYYDEKTLS